MERLVFIIDDDQVYLKFMISHFRQMAGFKVETYTNGDKAIEALATKSPFMVILDHNFANADKNGIDYLKQIKKLKPSLPVIYITSDSSEALRKEVTKLGVGARIIKSESFLVQLRTAIDEITSPKKKGLLSKIFK